MDNMKLRRFCFFASLVNIFVFANISPREHVGIFYKTGINKIFSRICLEYFDNAYLINLICFIVLVVLLIKNRHYKTDGFRIKTLFAAIVVFISAILMFILPRTLT